MARTFLTAEWRDLLMLNYELPAQLLHEHVPRGTELDTFEGRTLVSLVGFRFLRSCVYGVPIPGHGAFEEVNLRFYVRSIREPSRRGVVFLKEIVPRRAVTWVSRAFFEENYHTHPMSHAIEETADGTSIRYSLHAAARAHHLRALARGVPAPLVARSEAEFIAEHYYGYTRLADGGTSEYRVDHPSWLVRPVRDAELDLDVAALYGEPFAPFLAARPRSAFLALGSAVRVGTPTRLEPAGSR